jgi:RNA polymerase sigma factor (sigma-70 family)
MKKDRHTSVEGLLEKGGSATAKELEEERLLEEEMAEKNYPSREEMAKLNVRRLAGDEKAREKMIVGNLPMATWYAFRQTGGPINPRFDDVCQEASIGIMEAVDRFDHNKPGSFGTYAMWLIRQRVNRSWHNTASTIRVGVNARQEATKVKDTARKLQVELGRKPEPEEISKVTGFSVEKIGRLFRIPMGTASLDEKLGIDEGKGSEMMEIVPDEKTRTPDQVAALIDDGKAIVDQLEDLLAHLEEKLGSSYANCQTGVRIFSSRYGLFGRPAGGKNLEEVGVEFGITRERVRQICAKAFKLRRIGGYSFQSESELNSSLEILRSSIETVGPENVPARHLWIAGLSTSVKIVERPVEVIDNSDEAILGRLIGLAKDMDLGESEARKLAATAGITDFNIPQKSASYILATRIEKPSDPKALKKMRSGYKLEILCSDPIEIWERQGQLFPSQLKEARSKLRAQRKMKEHAEDNIKAMTDVPEEFKDALLHRYGLNGSNTCDTDDDTFSEIAGIRKNYVGQVLRNLWSQVSKGGTAITSDEQFLKTTNEIPYWELLVNG